MSHFRFKPELLNVKQMFLQKATVGGGGFLSCIEDGKKIKVPMNPRICRKFGDTFYTTPIDITVLFYGNDAISFTDDIFDGYDTAYTDIIDQFKRDVTDRVLYYDGRLIYSLDYTVEPTKLSESGFFTHVRIPAYNPELLLKGTRFVFSGYDGVMCNNVVSIPIWSEMLSTLMKYYTGTPTYFFDAIDNVRSLNLHGLLKLCNMSAKNFGMESIECFELVSYIREFKTVNLPRLGKKVKMTSPTGLTFSDMIAFHIGKIMKCESYEQLKAIQQSITFLTSYCIIENDTLDINNIFIKGKKLVTLPAGSHGSFEE